MITVDLYCSKCESYKPKGEFYISSKSNTGYQRWCKTCCSAYSKMRRPIANARQNKARKNRNDNIYKYDISRDDYDRILDEQSGVCAICKKPETEKRKWLCIDHDERTGYVRGLLCAKCNRGIGLASHWVENFSRAIGYLNHNDAAISKKERYWLQQCVDSANKFSTCFKAKYYAVLIDRDGYQVSQGWNGPPKRFPHCDDGGCQRVIDATISGTTYSNCVAQHAEAGAIYRSELSRRPGSTLIVNGTPCFDCAKAIVHAGISRVIGIHDESYNFEEQETLFALAKVKVVRVRYEDL